MSKATEATVSGLIYTAVLAVLWYFISFEAMVLVALGDISIRQRMADR